MDSRTHQLLARSIYQYYPIGFTQAKNWNRQLNNIIADKIDGKLELLKQWDAVVKDLRNGNLKIENLSWLQFPNLMLVVEHAEKIQDLVVYKNLILCASLLCPFYTCFYQYETKVSIENGIMPLSSLAFSSTKGFDTLRSPTSCKIVQETFERFFTNYTFLGHFDLMVNKLYGGVPHGIDKIYNTNLEYSMYQFLFNGEQPLTIHS